VNFFFSIVLFWTSWRNIAARPGGLDRIHITLHSILSLITTSRIWTLHLENTVAHFSSMDAFLYIHNINEFVGSSLFLLSRTCT